MRLELNVFGFHHHLINKGDEQLVISKDKIQKYSIHNISQILGYLPITSIFIGVFRIASSLKEIANEIREDVNTVKYNRNDEILRNLPTRAIYITRGALEIFGFGPMLLIIDTVATVARAAFDYRNKK